MGFLDLVYYLWIFFFISGLIVMLIWLIVMNKALDQVSHDLRRMEPGAIWLCLIPVFGFVWQFMVTNAVSEGIAKELLARNMLPKEEKPAYGYGLSGCILLCCCFVPYVGVCIAIIGLALMVVHMIKITEYNSELQKTGRWESRYNERMAAIREQMNASWQQQNLYPSYQTPAGYIPPPPPSPMPSYHAPPPGYYNPAEIKTFSKKDKPENPFG